MSSYVALTRVERRKDLVILRPFPLEIFQQGQKPGMDLLLRTWRGDKDIDWQQIEKDMMPCKLCPTCGCIKLKTSFTITEFKRLDENNEKSVYVSYVKQYKERRIYLCSVRIAFRSVRSQITLRERHIGAGALSVFVVTVILKRNVVYVTCIANDNIFLIRNGFV